MAEKSLDLDEAHDVFACEAIRRLNAFYNIFVELPQTSEGVSYYTEDIHWGIITISYLFRKDYFKIFDGLGTKLMNLKDFRKCCMTIPVKRNDRYFFNFLKRVSTIHEMAVYSYRRGNDYFEAARYCLAQFQDKDYFHSAGSWQRLDKIGSFFAKSSKLMQLVINQESRLRFPVRFTLAVEMIETRFEEENNVEMLRSEEVRFLREQKEKFIAREQVATESVTKIIRCPIKREENPGIPQSHYPRQTKESNQLGSIEDEIKAAKDFLKSLSSESRKSCEGMKEKIINNTKSSKRERPCMSGESADLSEYDHLETEFQRKCSFKEKNFIKSKLNPNFEQGASVDDDTEGYSLESSGSSISKFISHSKMNKTEENVIIDFKQLEDDLYLSESSVEENWQQNNMKKSCEDNQYLLVDSGLHASTDFTVLESHSPTRYTSFSNEDNDYLKLLEEDLYVKAASFEFLSYSDYSDSESSQPYSAVNSLTKEDRKRMLNNILFSDGRTESSITYQSSTGISGVRDDMMPLGMPSSSASASFPDKIDSDSSGETDYEEHQVTSSKSVESNKPDAAHKCSKNLNVNIENSQTNPKSQQRKGKRRKKKGKSKK